MWFSFPDRKLVLIVMKFSDSTLPPPQPKQSLRGEYTNKVNISLFEYQISP